MKKLIISELVLLFLATTFISDNPNPGWVQQTLPVNDLINDIYFLDSLTGWVVTDGRTSTNDTGYIMKTVNGGNNWVVQYNQPMKLNAVQFIDVNTGYVVGGSGSGTGRIFKTTNGGLNWINTSTFVSNFTDLFFVNNNTGWVTDPTGVFGGLFKTVDGGNNWQLQLSGTFFPQKLFFINADTGWAGSADWKLYRTTNSGQVWELQYTFTGAPNVFFPTKDTGYTGLYKSTNGGYNWAPMNNGQGGSGIFFLNNLTGYSCAGFSVMQKTIDGQNWFNQTVPVGGWVSIQFTDTSKGWAGGSTLVHTTDGGGPPAGIIQISSKIPSAFKLYQNYPNPFNPVTKIKYDVKRQTSNVKLIVYDIQGKLITELVNQKQNPGTYEVVFNGSGLSSGAYFYKIIITSGKEGFSDVKKMVLLK